MVDPNATSPTRGDGGEIHLASLLNILWRRRWIFLGFLAAGVLAGLLYGAVVTPLYRATATIRPGITAFSPQGGGTREWQLKDVQRWFSARLYRDAVAESLGVSRSQAPIIDADFVMRGLQNIQGGNVVTLSVLDPSPERAARVLAAAMDGFDAYAMADTLSNSLALTQRGLRLQIAERERMIARVHARVDSLEAEIGLAQAESLQTYKEIALVTAQIAQIQSENERLAEQAELFASRRLQLDARIAELDAAREAAERRIGAGDASGGDLSGLRPGTVLTETAVYRDLVETTARLQGQRFTTDARADSVRQRIASNVQQIERIRTDLDKRVEGSRIDSARRLGQLRFARDVGVPSALLSLRLQIREREAQLVSLRPLERIGSVMVSERPVRPRKMRALLILGFFGGIGGFVLAYVYDYVWKHRREIFQS